MARLIRYSKSSLIKAKQMRREPSLAEKILWKELRRKQTEGVRFRRQQPIGPYIADYYCSELALVIEIDGETHGGREEYDLSRQQWLEANGIKVIRFSNSEIYKNLQGVLHLIRSLCTDREKGETRRVV